MKDDARGKKRSDVVGAAVLLLVCTLVAAAVAAALGAVIAHLEGVRGTLDETGAKLLFLGLFSVVLTVIWPASLFVFWKLAGKRHW
jgi:hypothetical protein